MRAAEKLAFLFLLLGLTGCRSAKAPEQIAAPVKSQQEMKPNVETAPSQTVTPESIVKDMFPNAPEKTRSVECFRSFTPEMSVYMLVQKCGRPDEEIGSGLYVFVYHLADGSTVGISTPYLNRIDYLTATDRSGKRISILSRGKVVH